MEKQAEQALATFKQGFNCAQSVISAFCAQYGVDEALALRFAGSFGGGMRCGEVCGAVTGALMVIGLKYGQTDAADKASKEQCGQTALAFMEQYKHAQGSNLCRDLLGFDIRDAEARAKNPDRIKQVCPGAIEAAVQLLQELGF